MKIIARVAGTQMYLVSLSGQLTKNTEGFIADINRGMRYQIENLQSLLARGYWEPEDHDDDKLKELMALEEFQPDEEEESRSGEGDFVEAIRQLGDRLEQSLVNRPQLIHVEMPRPRKQVKRVIRDESGQILAIEEGEIDNEDNGQLSE